MLPFFGEVVVSQTPAIDIVWVDTAFKGLVLAGVALILVQFAQWASSSVRYFMLLATVMGLVFLPVFSFSPQWHALPEWLDVAKSLSPEAAVARTEGEPLSGPGSSREAASPGVATGSPASGQRAESELVEMPTAADRKSDAPPSGEVLGAMDFGAMHWPTLLFGVWLIGTAALGMRLMAGLIASWCIRSHLTLVRSGPVFEATKCCADELKLDWLPRVLVSTRHAMPMTWGTIRPTVVLPHEAEQWDPQRLRVVMLHELGHIVRNDNLTLFMAQVARALHWFNPLVWIIERRMVLEREQACDDLVVRGHVPPAEYAQELLQIASTLQGSFRTPHAAIPMARKSQLEGRLMSVLDKQRNREPLVLSKAFAIAAGTLVIVTAIGLMSPSRSDSPLIQSEAPLESASSVNELATNYFKAVRDNDAAFLREHTLGPRNAPLVEAEAAELLAKFAKEFELNHPDGWKLGEPVIEQDLAYLPVVIRVRKQPGATWDDGFLILRRGEDRWLVMSLDDWGSDLSPEQKLERVRGQLQSEGPEAAMPALSQSIERTINDIDDLDEGHARIGLRLSDGKVFDLPQEGRKWNNEKLLKWASECGIDIFADYAKNRWAIMATQIELAKATPLDWEEGVTPEEFARRLLGDEPGLDIKTSGGCRYYLLPRNAEVPMHFLFDTQKGQRGVLQIKAMNVAPRSLTLRYRLAPPPTARVTKSHPSDVSAISEPPFDHVSVTGDAATFDSDYPKTPEADDQTARGAAALAPVSGVPLGVVTERTVRDDGAGQEFMIDFETGRLFTPTPKHRERYGARPPDPGAFVAREGWDAMCDTAKGRPGLYGFDMIAIPIAQERWENMEIDELREALSIGKPGTPAFMAAERALPATYIFKTREGSMGMLQILEFLEGPPDGVKLRYVIRERVPVPKSKKAVNEGHEHSKAHEHLERMVRTVDTIASDGHGQAYLHGPTEGHGHDAVGHDAVGHDAVGHDAVGHDAVGHDAVGHDAVGLDAVGLDAVGLDAVGLDAVGHDAVGHDAEEHGHAGHHEHVNDVASHDPSHIRKPNSREFDAFVGAWRLTGGRENEYMFIAPDGTCRSWDSSGREDVNGSIARAKEDYVLRNDKGVVVNAVRVDRDEISIIKLSKTLTERTGTRVFYDVTFVGSWRASEFTGSVGQDYSALQLDLAADGTFQLFAEGSVAGPQIKGNYVVDGSSIQLLRPVSFIKSARYDNGMIRLAIADGAALLQKTETPAVATQASSSPRATMLENFEGHWHGEESGTRVDFSWDGKELAVLRQQHAGVTVAISLVPLPGKEPETIDLRLDYGTEKGKQSAVIACIRRNTSGRLALTVLPRAREANEDLQIVDAVVLETVPKP